jgi:serine/threonine protein kinase
LIKILGEGAFAKVLLVRKKASGKLFAMKVIDKKKIMMTEEDCNGAVSAEELATRNMYRVKQIISERNIFSVMNSDPNPFIVQLHSAFTSKNSLFMVLDLCPGGDLFSLIQKHRNFTAQQAKYIFAEILVAVEHLHKHDILYRDLKPENIIIDEWGHFKLTDFGLSKENFSDEDMAKTVCGSPEYFCPEILQDQPYGRTIDYYSLGVLLYELITGLPPHYNTDQFQM